MRHLQRIISTPPDASGFVMMRHLPSHRLLLLVLLALALGAVAGLLWLTPTDSAHAQAQGTVWSAKLTVSASTTSHGCADDSTNLSECSDALSRQKFRYQGTTYRVDTVYWSSLGAGTFRIWFDDGTHESNDGARIKNALGDLTLNVDGTPLEVAEAAPETGGFIYWTYNPATAWTAGQKVTLSLTRPLITVTSVEYASSPSNGSFYRAGETIAFAVNFSDAVTAESDDMWLTLDIGGQQEVADLVAGGGTNRWFFTHQAYEVDRGEVTVDDTGTGRWVGMGTRTERKYGEYVSFQLQNNKTKDSPQTVKGSEMVPAPGYVPSATCNAAGTKCTVPHNWKLIPKHLKGQTGASFRLMYITTQKTLATSTNISAYNTFVKNEVPSWSPLYELRSYIRAMANAQQGADLRTNTRTRAGDPGIWTPIYWVKGHQKKGKVADGHADLYDGSWDSSTVKGGRASNVGGKLGSEPWAWTGSKSDGSPDYKPGTGGYDRRLGATNSQRGKALTEGQELNADSPYESNDPQGVGEPMYAITPILTISEAPYVPPAPGNLMATPISGGATLSWDAYADPKKIWWYEYKLGKGHWREILGLSFRATSWTLDENYGTTGEGPPWGKPLKNKEYTLQIRAVSIDGDGTIKGEAAEVKFTSN